MSSFDKNFQRVIRNQINSHLTWKRLTWTISVAPPANEVLHQVLGIAGSCWSCVFAARLKPCRTDSWAARPADSRRRWKTRRLLAHMAWIMEMIRGERDWERSSQVPQRSRVLAVLGQFSPFKNVGSDLGTCCPSPHCCTAAATSHFWYSGGTGTVNRTWWTGI